MTRNKPKSRLRHLAAPVLTAALAVILAALCAGCGREVDAFPNPGDVSESGQIMRYADTGVVVVVFASFPLRDGVPPDGVRRAVAVSLGRRPCSAATFFWSENILAERWIEDQLERRRRAGLPPRLILAGHGLGASAASEMAKTVMARNQDVEIVLLLTVDAVKTGRIESAAGVAGSAIVNRLPGVNMNFIAYDAAPAPDGRRLWSHINYYQDKSQAYHGAAMPGAENHHIDDWTGALNHGDADDFVYPLLTVDIRAALERGTP